MFCTLWTVVFVMTFYCKFGNFPENFIFANSLKDIFASFKFATREWVYLFKTSNAVPVVNPIVFVIGLVVKNSISW